jgi:outer membrane lipoprotein SlyB
MKIRSLAIACVMAFTAVVAAPQTQAPTTPKTQYAVDSKTALTRYENDKKLCNDETTANGRLQCRRDAQDEYDKAIAAAKAQLAAATPQADGAAACPDCGTVVAVSVKEKAGEGSPLGVIAGGVGGAILGHQVGSGKGKDLATIAGAVGGAYAGKKIEERVKTHKVWTVRVDYPDGSKKNIEFNRDPGFKVGSSVKNSGATIVRP